MTKLQRSILAHRIASRLLQSELAAGAPLEEIQNYQGDEDFTDADAQAVVRRISSIAQNLQFRADKLARRADKASTTG